MKVEITLCDGCARESKHHAPADWLHLKATYREEGKTIMKDLDLCRVCQARSFRDLVAAK